MLKAYYLLTLCFIVFNKPPAFIDEKTNIFEFGLKEENYSISSIVINGLHDPILRSDTPSCSIPFTKAGKLILLKGRAGSTEGNFVLDTGAPYLVLNSTYFRDLKLVENKGEMQRDINGQSGHLQKTIVKQFNLGSFNYSSVETDLINLGNIENARGVKILGLLGVSLFKNCELIIDYNESVIHLYHISRKERKSYKHQMLNDPEQYTEHPFFLRDNRIIVNTKVANKRMQFVIDYAAETNIIDSRLPGSVLDSVLINGRVLLAGTGTKKVEAVTGYMTGFSIDKLPLKDFPVIITSLKNSCFANDMCINGVLGYDFLSRHKMVFNFVTGKLYIFK